MPGWERYTRATWLHVQGVMHERCEGSQRVERPACRKILGRYKYILLIYNCTRSQCDYKCGRGVAHVAVELEQRAFIALGFGILFIGLRPAHD